MQTMTYIRKFAGFSTPEAILIDTSLGLAEKRMALMSWRRTLQTAPTISYMQAVDRNELIKEINRTISSLPSSPVQSAS